MGGYLAVQQGSAFDPVFIHLTYKPAVKDEFMKKIVLIGE